MTDTPAHRGYSLERQQLPRSALLGKPHDFSRKYWVFAVPGGGHHLWR